MTQGVTETAPGRSSPVVWIVLVAIVAAVIAIGFFSRDDGLDNAGTFADPNGTGLEGLLGLRLFIEEGGGQTALDVGLPDDSIDVAILALDGPAPFLFEEGEAFVESWVPLLDWVEDGGVLITSIDVATAPTLSTTDIDGDEFARPGICTADNLTTVGEIRTLDYSPVQIEPGDSSCFGDDDEAFVVSRPVGQGQIIRLSTMAPLMNRSLDDANNGALAARLIDLADAPTVGFLEGAPIYFEPADEVTPLNLGDPETNGDQIRRTGNDEPLPFSTGDLTPLDEDGNPVGAGTQTLWQLIEDRVKVLIAGLVFAAAIYVLAVGRRLGSPVIEPLPIELPSSSYVDAIGRLYQRTPDSIERSAAILRNDLRSNLARRVGMSTESSTLELAKAVSGSNGRDQLVAALDGPTPTTDEEFAMLAKELIEIRERVDRGGVGTLATRVDEPFMKEESFRV